MLNLVKAIRADRMGQGDDRRLTRAGMLFLAGTVAFVGGRWAIDNYAPKIGFSQTESLPWAVYKVDTRDRSPERGDYMVLTREEVERLDGRTLAKRVVGVPGDVVRVEGRVVYVGELEVGRAKEVSRKGEKLEATTGMVIPSGRYFVAGSHADSFDSRYADFGLATVSDFVGTAKPLF